MDVSRDTRQIPPPVSSRELRAPRRALAAHRRPCGASPEVLAGRLDRRAAAKPAQEPVELIQRSEAKGDAARAPISVGHPVRSLTSCSRRTMSGSLRWVLGLIAARMRSACGRRGRRGQGPSAWVAERRRSTISRAQAICASAPGTVTRQRAWRGRSASERMRRCTSRGSVRRRMAWER